MNIPNPEEKEMTDYTEEALASLFPEKVCGNDCNPEPQPRAAFNKNKYNRDGLQKICRACLKERRQFLAEQPKKVKVEMEEHECAKCRKIFLRANHLTTRCDDCKKKAHYCESDLGGS